jgi:hypothetical protein
MNFCTNRMKLPIGATAIAARGYAYAFYFGSHAEGRAHR